MKSYYILDCVCRILHTRVVRKPKHRGGMIKPKPETLMLRTLIANGDIIVNFNGNLTVT